MGNQALVTVVPKAQLTVNGPVKKYSSKGSSGHDVHRLFCSECGSPIAHDPDAAPEIIAIKAGTLSSDIKQKLKPVGSFSCFPGVQAEYRIYAGCLLADWLVLGYRDLGCVQVAFLPGALGQAVPAYAGIKRCLDAWTGMYVTVNEA